MAVTARWYAAGIQRFMLGDLNWDPTGGSSVKMALFVTAHTPDVDADTLFSGLSNECVDGDYTAGGEAMTLVAAAVVQDTSVTARADTTAYVVGDLVRPASANGYIYRCITAGTSGTGEPTWPTTVGKDVQDNATAVYWENVGTSYIKLDATDVSFGPSVTISAAYAVIYETASSYLIGIVDFDGTESSTNGDFDVNFDANGVLQAFVSL